MRHTVNSMTQEGETVKALLALSKKVFRYHVVHIDVESVLKSHVNFLSMIDFRNYFERFHVYFSKKNSGNHMRIKTQLRLKKRFCINVYIYTTLQTKWQSTY